MSPFTRLPGLAADSLDAIASALASVSPLNQAGYRIAVGVTPEPFPPGVDTPEDLARAEAWIASGHG